MRGFAIRIARAAGLLLLIYLVTLLFFLIDSARVANKAVGLIESVRSNESVSGELGSFAKDLERYSHSLDSPLLSPLTLLVGDTESIRKVGKVVGAGARALIVLSSLVDNEIEDVKLADTEILARDAKLIKKASKDIALAFEGFASIEFSGLLSPLNSKLGEVQAKVTRYQEVFTRTSPLLSILPDLLGNYSKRSYFIAMQNSAQGRGTGGLLGTFAILSIDKGKMSLDYVAPNTALEIQPDIPIDVPSEYRDIYRDYAKSWNGSNFSPHFPYAAQIWAETWKRMTGQEVDGVISIDTYMLRALLAASGPVDIEDYQINSENVIQELLSNAYVRFESDPERRKNYLAEVAKTVAERFISGSYSKTTLLRQIIDPILENRVNIYSPYPREAKFIALTPLSGVLDDQPNNEYRLVIQNIAGNKMDYYIARELTVMSEQCTPIRTTRVDLVVTNTADANTRLPAYVNALRAQGFPQGNQNAQFAGIFLYGPTSAKITGVIDTDTGQTYGWVYTERNRPLYSAQVMIAAGESKRISVFFEGGSGELESVLQPLVLPQKTVIADSCTS